MSTIEVRIILSGPPGIGKTTVIKKVSELLLQANIPVQGFFTEEIRKNGNRIGFDIVDIYGERSALARVTENTGVSSEPCYTVGKYTVKLNEFEKFQNKILAKVSNGVVIIDEIGKMELFSRNFKQNVKNIFVNQSCSVIATIPVKTSKPNPFVEEIRNNKQHKLFIVDHKNRNTLTKTIFEIISKNNDKYYEGIEM